MGVAIEEREPEAGCQENKGTLGLLLGLWGHVWEKGPACILGGNDGLTVNRRPGVGAVHLQQIKTGWPHGDNKQNRVKNKGGGVRETSEGSGGGVSLSDLWRSKLH